MRIAKKPATGRRVAGPSLVTFALVPLLLAACERGPGGAVPPELVQARQVAARDACAAAAVLERSQENLEAVEPFAQLDSETSGAANAAFRFASALEQHAQLRYAALVRVDSALNHARTPADSARYVEAARQFLPRTPQAGTVEGNVADAWARDFTRILDDEDHRCNWDV